MKLFAKFFVLFLFNFVKSQESDQISVALVVDATSSMTDEIQAVKNVSNHVLKRLYRSNDSFIKNFILSVFRDPNVDRFINTTNPEEIANELSITETNESELNKDCPEASMTGISAALNSTLQDSLMFVFTDDEPKDKHLKDSVLKKLKQQQVKVFFMLTKSSSCRRKKKFETHKEIAKETGGMVIPLREAEIEKILETFSSQFNEGFLPFVSENFDAGSNKTNFTVGTGDKALTIQSTAEVIIVYGPNSSVYYPTSIGEAYKIIKLEKPEPETYEVNTESPEKYSVHIGAISNIKFSYGFSLSRTNVKYCTLKHPIEGQDNYLTVFVIKGEIMHLNSIILTYGENHTKISLETVEFKKIYRTRYFFGKESFKITVQGQDSDGNRILRILSNTVSPAVPVRNPLTKKDCDEIDKFAKKKNMSKRLAEKLKEENISVEVLEHSLTNAEIDTILKGYDDGRYFGHGDFLLSFSGRYDPLIKT